jgi:hypothetical protein
MPRVFFDLSAAECWVADLRSTIKVTSHLTNGLLGYLIILALELFSLHAAIQFTFHCAPNFFHEFTTVSGEGVMNRTIMFNLRRELSGGNAVVDVKRRSRSPSVSTDAFVRKNRGSWIPALTVNEVSAIFTQLPRTLL